MAEPPIFYRVVDLVAAIGRAPAQAVFRLDAGALRQDMETVLHLVAQGARGYLTIAGEDRVALLPGWELVGWTKVLRAVRGVEIREAYELSRDRDLEPGYRQTGVVEREDAAGIPRRAAEDR